MALPGDAEQVLRVRIRKAIARDNRLNPAERRVRFAIDHHELYSHTWIPPWDRQCCNYCPVCAGEF